jgi:hypothetical protein
MEDQYEHTPKTIGAGTDRKYNWLDKVWYHTIAITKRFNYIELLMGEYKIRYRPDSDNWMVEGTHDQGHSCNSLNAAIDYVLSSPEQCVECGEPATFMVFKGGKRTYVCNVHLSDNINTYGINSEVMVKKIGQENENAQLEK